MLSPQYFGLVVRILLMALLVGLQVSGVIHMPATALMGVLLIIFLYELYERWHLAMHFTIPDNVSMFIDLGVIVIIARYSGTTVSPVIVFVYTWLFAIVLASRRRTIQRKFEYSLFFALIAIIFAGVGGPNFSLYFSMHVIALGMFWLETEILVRERRQNDIDPLTGVLARGPGLTAMEKWVKAGIKFELVFLDLGEFKKINDRYGHLVGDEVIKEVARRLGEKAYKDDLVIRFGGDEFVFASQSGQVGERLARIFVDPVGVEEQEISIVGDIGLEGFDPSNSAHNGQSAARTLDDLLAQSDTKMYQRKKTRQYERPS